MDPQYLINNKVIFNTTEGELIDINTPSSRISLNRPIARCLQLLIQNHGKITGQEEFFEYVWRSRGANITANTYYQNISILRRALSQMGLGDEMIKTVSRKGLMLSHASVVVPFIKRDKIKSEAINAIACINDRTTSLSPATLTDNYLTEKEQDKFNPLLSILLQSKKSSPSLYSSFVLLIVISLAITLAVFFNSDESKEMDFFSNYAYIDKINQCDVYSNHTFSQDEEISLNAYNIECDTEKNVFMTYYYFSPDVYFLACRKKPILTSLDSCISYYYIGGTDEN